MDYCTIDQLKRKLKRPAGADVYNDTYLGEAITRSSRIIDTLTSTFFYEKTISNLIIDRYSIIDNIAILNNTIILNAPLTDTVPIVIVEDEKALTENTDFYAYKTAGTIEKSHSWSTNRKSIDLTCSIGYTTPPTDIVTATLEIAQILTGLGVQVVQGDDGDIEGFISTKIPSIVKKTLNRYRWVTI
jgi:hypothetical protein